MIPAAFIRIPRTGSSSMGAALHIDESHKTAIERKTGDNGIPSFKFAFVRHPFDRFLSTFYFFNLHMFGEYTDPNVFLAENDLNEFTADEYHKTFLRPQSDYIFDENGVLMVDFLGRYETLDTDYALLCGKLGVSKVELPWIGRTTENKAILNELSKAKLTAFYAKDFLNLKY